MGGSGSYIQADGGAKALADGNGGTRPQRQSKASSRNDGASIHAVASSRS